MKFVYVDSGSYYDSVHLMRVSESVEALDGVSRALVAMATDSNRDLARSLGFDVPDSVVPDDMIIAIEINDEAHADAIVAEARKIARARVVTMEDGYRPKTLDAALAELPDAQLVVVSVAGTYATREAEAALDRGRHVMIFSDNVSAEDEIRLKRRAAAAGLLVMGPDCGTAIVNAVPLCFANRVRPGAIGVVAASGTGLQEVTSRIHNLGGGVSQAIGTGGRDLKLPAAPALMMRLALRALAADEATKVIVVVSKPPSPEIAETLMDELATIAKPTVMHLVGGVPASLAVPESITIANTLAATAELALSASGAPTSTLVGEERERSEARRAAVSGSVLDGGRRFLRGLFTGGTLADELIAIAAETIGPISSVGGSAWGPTLTDPQQSEGHTVVDLGEDIFTEGRPHPMIDPTIRLERLAREAADPETAVIALDFVLGTGSHEDPIGATIATIESAMSGDDAVGPVWIATVVGTDEDPQERATSIAALERAGVIVAESNAEAAELAVTVLTGLTTGKPVERRQSTKEVPAGATPLASTKASTKSGSADDLPLGHGLSTPLFGTSLATINVGVAAFATDMRSAGANVVDLDWRPPARGNARMAELLKKLGR